MVYIYNKANMCVKCVYCSGDTKKMYLNKERYKCIECKKTFTNGSPKIVKIKNISEVIELHKKGKNCSEIAKIYNCDPENIRYHLKKNGVNTSISFDNIKCVYCDGKTQKSGKSNGKQRFFCVSCDKIFNEDFIQYRNNNNKFKLEKHNLIKKLYLVDNLSTTEIGDKLGLTATGIQTILKQYGVIREIGHAKELRYAKDLGLSHNDYIKRLPVFKKYRKNVTKITNKQPLHELKNYDKRGKCGVDGAYQLDHKYSVLEGFKNDISPEIIGNIKNLEIISWEENALKGSKCSITIEELIDKIALSKR